MRTKRFLSILLTLAMIFSSVSTNVIFADVTEADAVVSITKNSNVTYSDDFKSALESATSSSQLKLLKDVTLDCGISDGTYTFPNINNLTIDLNGNTISGGNTKEYEISQRLAIKDSGNGGSIEKPLSIVSGAKFTISGGKFGNIKNEGGGLTISGGEFDTVETNKIIKVSGGKFGEIKSPNVLLTELLVDGKAYFDESEKLIDVKGLNEILNVTILDHECSAGEDDKCACGRDLTSYTVQVTKGKGMSTNNSETQTVLKDKNISTITYSVEDSYYLPFSTDNVDGYPKESYLKSVTINGQPISDESIENFNVGEEQALVNGILIKSFRNEFRISGKPTEDIAIVLGDATEREAAPEGPALSLFTVGNASSTGTADGSISGVDSSMEYKSDGETTAILSIDEGETTISNLLNGKYLIRYKSANYYQSPSAWTAVVVGASSYIIEHSDGSKELGMDFADDLKNAKSGDKFKLTQDIGFSDEDINFPETNVTIDLNGKEFGYTGAKTLALKSGTELTIEDSVGEGNLNGSLDITNGTLKISGGRFWEIKSSNLFNPFDLIEKGKAYFEPFTEGRLTKIPILTESISSVKVLDHTCDFVDGECECGRVNASILIENSEGDPVYIKSDVLTDAFDEIKDNSIVRLITDVKFSEEFTNFPNKRFTIDLNGKNINCDKSVALFGFERDTNLTIKDSTGKGKFGGSLNCSTGKLNVFGGNILKIILNGGNVKLSGGTINIISKADETEFNPFDLIEDGRAYFDTDGYIKKVNNSVTSILNVCISKHTCDFDDKFECECGRKLHFSIEKSNGEVVYIRSDILADVFPDIEEDSIVKILTDVKGGELKNCYLPTKAFTLDLNGKKVAYTSSSDYFNINSDCEFTITDSVGGGVFDVGLKCNLGKLNVLGGTIRKIELNDGKKVQFFGGKVGEIVSETEFNPFEFLEDGKAYFDSVGNVKSVSDSTLSFSFDQILDHTCEFSSEICACGRKANVSIEKSNGDVVYFKSDVLADVFSDIEEGSTVKLLADIKCVGDEEVGVIDLPAKAFTLDLNGKKVDYTSSSDYFNINSDCELTITDSVGGGVFDVELKCNLGKLNVLGGTIRKIELNIGKEVQFFGGKVDEIVSRTEFNPFEFLEDGKAYFDSVGNVKSVSDSTLSFSFDQILDHTCEFSSETCACGRKADISIEKSNGEVVYFKSDVFSDVFTDIEEGSTVKLLSDVKFSEKTTSVDFPEKKFKIDLNGKKINSTNLENGFNVQGNTDLTIEDSVGGGNFDVCLNWSLPAKLKILSGTFLKISSDYEFNPYMLIPKGKAYFNNLNNSLLNFSAIYYINNFTVSDHMCSFDEYGVCQCGRTQTFDVKVSGGTGTVLKYGKEEQEICIGDSIYDIKYDALDGYYFSLSTDDVDGYPKESLFKSIVVNGKTGVEFTSKSGYDEANVCGLVITIYHDSINILGCPTDDVTISFPNATKKDEKKIDPPDVSKFTIVRPSSSDSYDGKIIGVSGGMQYKRGNEEYIYDVYEGDTEIGYLFVGKYYIRYAGDFYQNPSDWVEVEVSVCPHEKFNSDGKCLECGTISDVLITKKDGTIVCSFDDIGDVIANIEDGSTIKLLKNLTLKKGCDDNGVYKLPEKEFVINLNGKIFANGCSGFGKYELQDGTKLTIIGSEGRFTTEEDYKDSVIDATKGELTVYGGKMSLDGVGENVKLYGGEFSKILGSSEFSFEGLLGKEKAFKVDGKFVKPSDLSDESENISVCDCLHEFDEADKCVYCNVLKSESNSNWFGDGTAETFTIRTADELRFFARLVGGGAGESVSFEGKTVVLANDIDLLGSESNKWSPIGNDGYDFDGTFDGNGKKISGLYVDSSEYCQGLFGAVGGKGKVQNLGVSGKVKGNSNIGGLVGVNYGEILNCYSDVEVSCYDYSVGGLVGVNKGKILNCYSKGTVNGKFAGGFVGENQYDWYYGEYFGIISNCYSEAKVSGSEKVGGFVGSNGAMIESCYSTGDVSGNKQVGGFVGYRSGSAESLISNSYCTGDVSGNEQVGGFVGYCEKDILNSYSIGKVTSKGEDVGGFVGRAHNSVEITHCYYLENCQSEETTFSNEVGTAVGKEAFSNGEVARLLEDWQKANASASESVQVWGQKISGDETADEMPVLTSDGAIAVYEVEFNFKDGKTTEKKYSNASTSGLKTIPTATEHYGWFIDRDVEKKFDESTAINGDVKVYECVAEFDVDKSELQSGKVRVFAPKNGTYAVIFAAYKGGKLVSYKTANAVVSEETGSVVDVLVPEGFDSTGADNVKVMLWSSLEEMKPL